LARARIIRRSRGKVIAGPFAGQVYVTSPDDFIEPAMLMGSYEKELHPAIELLFTQPPKLFVHVGASQGYYAVGFARRARHARHIAFEFYAPRLVQLKRTAAANSVTLEYWGECSPPRLQEALSASDDVFVLVDVEGYEQELLDPVAVPLLKHARMIVETHDHVVPNITNELVRRFDASHVIDIVTLGPRTAADLPFLICDPWTVGQLDEGRGALQKWLLLTPKSPPADT
jgi:hypothetical protein